VTSLDRRSLGGMVTTVVALNVVGWGVLLLAVAPQRLAVGDAGVFGVGLGVTAFLLGIRHAFDADHIAAIDNTTRKLVGEGRPALSVGFWFSLGHSSVVFALSLPARSCWPSGSSTSARCPESSRRTGPPGPARPWTTPSSSGTSPGAGSVRGCWAGSPAGSARPGRCTRSAC
jgi:hypothetical protein